MTKDRYLFRGFHKEENGKETIYIDGQVINGKWVEGYYAKTDLGTFINQYRVDYEDECTYCEDFEVIPETIGQYTGLDDKNGKKIFENDVVFYSDVMNVYKDDITGVVKYTQDCMFKIEYDDKYVYGGKTTRPLVCHEHPIFTSKKIEVLRTIFDKEVKDNE